MDDHKEACRVGRDLGLRIFTEERFSEFHPRVYDAPGSKAWINERADFVVNYPIPTIDYDEYVPRADVLNLADPKKKQHYLRERVRILNVCLDGTSLGGLRVLELGCAEGACLEVILDSHPQANGVGVEPSLKHRELALQERLDVRASTADLDDGARFDLICSFHTFEHYLDPLGIGELEAQKKLLADGGVIICEMPPLTDPLLQLYGLEELKDFYFSAPTSLRVLTFVHQATADELWLYCRQNSSLPTLRIVKSFELASHPKAWRQ